MVKAKDSCQPEQAVEPFSKMSSSPDLDDNGSSSTTHKCGNTKLRKKLDPVLVVTAVKKH